jgi:hypothetical protein
VAAPAPPPAATPARPPAERAETPPPRRPSAPLAAGRLGIDAESAVHIEIDGRPYGPTPLAGVRLPRGEHRVLARYRDGRVGYKTVILGDEDVTVTFR